MTILEKIDDVLEDLRSLQVKDRISSITITKIEEARLWWAEHLMPGSKK